MFVESLISIYLKFKHFISASTCWLATTALSEIIIKQVKKSSSRCSFYLHLYSYIDYCVNIAYLRTGQPQYLMHYQWFPLVILLVRQVFLFTDDGAIWFQVSQFIKIPEYRNHITKHIAELFIHSRNFLLCNNFRRPYPTHKGKKHHAYYFSFRPRKIERQEKRPLCEPKNNIGIHFAPQTYGLICTCYSRQDLFDNMTALT